MSLEMAVALVKNGIKNISDIADLSSDEFIDICGESTANVATSIIMNARKISYGIGDTEVNN